ncbi:MAG: 50S ribosomal protein L25 [Desulfuromonadia bacterium]
MNSCELAVERRLETGKGVCRKLRAAGKVPGVVYGKGIDPVPVTVDPKSLSQAISGEGGQNNLITLTGDPALQGTLVLVADLFRDPIKRTIKHVDLHKVNLDDKVRVEVKVNLVGTAVGVKEGGHLDFPKHTIEIECLPAQIPSHIDVDITNLAIGHSIHVSEIPFPAGVKVLDDPKNAVVSILGHAQEAPAAAE